MPSDGFNILRVLNGFNKHPQQKMFFSVAPTEGGGGAGKKISDPSSLFDQNLAQVAEKGSSIPLSLPKKILKGGLGGGGGGSQRSISDFLEQLSFFIWPSL